MAGSRNRFIKQKPKKRVVRPKRSRAENRRSKTKTIPASKRPADMRKGVTYGDAGRPYKGPGGNPNGSGKGQAQQAPPAPKLPPRRKPTTAKVAPKATPKPKAKPKAAPKPKAAKKPATKTSTSRGPTKSGSYYRSQGSSTKGGPTKSGKNYGIKSQELRDALNNLKVRDYKKKK